VFSSIAVDPGYLTVFFAHSRFAGMGNFFPFTPSWGCTSEFQLLVPFLVWISPHLATSLSHRLLDFWCRIGFYLPLSPDPLFPGFFLFPDNPLDVYMHLLMEKWRFWKGFGG